MATDQQMLKAVQDLNRTLKEILSGLQDQNRILKKMSDRIPKGQTTSDEPVVVPPVEPEPVAVPSLEDPLKTYGWSMANSVQREGNLNIGDQKIEQDDSRWTWTGDGWERIELPSGET